MDDVAKIIEPLPWEWFDFEERPQPLQPDDVTPVEEGGHSRVYVLTSNKRVIPYKIFRKRSEKPRPWLILLHGMGLTIATFRGVSGYLFHSHDLALIDYSSLMCAARESGWPSGGTPIPALGDAVWILANLLGLDRFSLAGNSMGGGLCLLAALHDEAKHRVHRILLSNPACYPQRLPTMYRLARVPLLGELLMTMTRAEKLIGGVEFIGYVNKSRFEPELRGRYLRTMSQRHNRFRLMDMIRHLPANERDTAMAIHLGRLDEITQPVLLTWGLQDPLLVEGAGERLAHDLPHCFYETYPDLAHLPHEEAPDRVGPRWAAFLNAQ